MPTLDNSMYCGSIGFITARAHLPSSVLLLTKLLPASASLLSPCTCYRYRYRTAGDAPYLCAVEQRSIAVARKRGAGVSYGRGEPDFGVETASYRGGATRWRRGCRRTPTTMREEDGRRQGHRQRLRRSAAILCRFARIENSLLSHMRLGALQTAVL